MSIQTKKNLRLHKTTLRQLSRAALTQAAGGDVIVRFDIPDTLQPGCIIKVGVFVDPSGNQSIWGGICTTPSPPLGPDTLAEGGGPG